MENLGSIIAWAVTAIASIGAVSIFVKKYIGKAKKAIAIATEALNIVNDSIIAVEPDAEGVIRITAEEVAEIARHANLLKQQLSKK